MPIILDAVRRNVGEKFVYVSDREQYGMPDHWEAPAPDSDGKIRGDCEDFAILCFKGLRTYGQSPKLALVRTEVFPEGGTGWDHAVCTLQDPVSQVIWVLDNRYARPMLLTELPYTHWIRQVGAIDEPWEELTPTA